MTKSINPTLILGVANLRGKPLETPLFAAIHLTHSLLRRMGQLARLCEAHQIAWLATRDLEPLVYWDASDDAMTEQTSTYHVVSTSIYVELSARRRKRGGYGRLEVIGQTPVVDLAELVHMRQQRIVLDFREHEGQDERGEPFALAVIERLRVAGVWPRKTSRTEEGE